MEKNNCPKINSLLFVKIMVVKHKFLDFTYILTLEKGYSSMK